MFERLTRAAGAPLRWALRRSRRSFARDMIAIATEAHGQGARSTLWDGRLRGGVGVVTMERGSVQIFVDEDGYLVEWFGTNQHPVRHDRLRTKDGNALRDKVRQWTARWYVHQQRPSAGPHHMAI